MRHAFWLNISFLCESEEHLHINTICISYDMVYMSHDMLRTTIAEINCHNIRQNGGQFEEVILFKFFIPN